VAGRIVLFGATGFTGELTARALAAAPGASAIAETAETGARPDAETASTAAPGATQIVLAGRDERRVRALAEELGGLEWAAADVQEPRSVRALVEEGDVLVSTVGPFERWGKPALEAAVDAGAHYLDSTGEGRFIRDVFERYGPRAQAAGCGLLPAFGYDFVPGNLAGALALAHAGPAASKVRVGYFMVGAPMGPSSLSGGTRASAGGVMLGKGFAFRGGRLVEERPGAHVRSFDLGNGKRAQTISIAGSEHLALPRCHPGLTEVGVYLGWFGPASRLLQGLSWGLDGLTRWPAGKRGLDRLMAATAKGSTGGPDAANRRKSRSVVLGEALDAAGTTLSAVRLEGVNGYDFTARVLAWGARTAAGGRLQGTGALGPVDGFGLDALQAGCEEAGLERVA
jgi:short subunit dehydrogenase-like uncharacterized protein